MSDFDCHGCGLTCRSERDLTCHMWACASCQPRERALAVLARTFRRHGQKRRRPPSPALSDVEAEEASDLPVFVPPALSPLRLDSLDPIAAFGNERTFVYFKYTLHDGHFSHMTAAQAIATQLATTSPEPPLLLEAASGLRNCYAVCDVIADELGMTFATHKLELTLGEGPTAICFTATLHLRSLLACCRLLFARCRGKEHCVPTKVVHEGSRVFSHPMTALWAEQHFAAIRRVDPSGLLFPVDVGWDKSPLSKVQDAYPLYVKANAWPLDDQNAHRGRLTWGYYDDIPDELKLQLSAAKATQARVGWWPTSRSASPFASLTTRRRCSGSCGRTRPASSTRCTCVCRT